MKQRPVNLERSDANIAEQYPNIFDGLQKDAGQNSWDARTTKRGKDWKLVFRYIHERNILVIEDFGTTGMDEDKWTRYQGLWDTTKMDIDALGARGQGKFLFHYFSADKTVLTETIDQHSTYRFSYGTTSVYDDENSKLQDTIPGAAVLNHQGTRIWIMNIKPEFREELLNYIEFGKFVASTWWEIIRNYNATFVINFDGVDRIVSIPKLSPEAKGRQLEATIKDFGKIRNLTLSFRKEDVPEEFRGIAIQRGGMTVLRLTVNAEDSIKNKICGYIDFDDALESELKKCEMPNHFGFFNKKAWNHVRDYIRKAVDEFVLTVTPKKEKIDVSSEIVSEAVKLVNELVSEYAPELLTGTRTTGGKGGEERTSQPKVKPPVRISSFHPNQHHFEYNETLMVTCEILNDTGTNEDLEFKFHIRHAEGDEKHRSRYNIFVPSHTSKGLDIQLIDFGERTDKPGEYTAEGILLRKRTNEDLHRKTFRFYLKTEPPKIGRSFISGFGFIKGRKSDGTLQFFGKWKNLPINEKGVMNVIFDHPEFVRARERAKTKRDLKKDMLLYIVSCGINEALQKLLEMNSVEKVIEPDKIRSIRQSCDEMLYEAAIRTE